MPSPHPFYHSCYHLLTPSFLSIITGYFTLQPQSQLPRHYYVISGNHTLYHSLIITATLAPCYQLLSAVLFTFHHHLVDGLSGIPADPGNPTCRCRHHRHPRRLATPMLSARVPENLCLAQADPHAPTIIYYHIQSVFSLLGDHRR